jgi:hypothetical protein
MLDVKRGIHKITHGRKMQTLKIGDKVPVYDNMTGNCTLAYTGTVVKITPSFITLNANGEDVKFNLKTGRVVGYDWPYLAHVIRS